MLDFQIRKLNIKMDTMLVFIDRLANFVKSCDAAVKTLSFNRRRHPSKHTNTRRNKTFVNLMYLSRRSEKYQRTGCWWHCRFLTTVQAWSWVFTYYWLQRASTLMKHLSVGVLHKHTYTCTGMGWVTASNCGFTEGERSSEIICMTCQC